MSDKPDLAAGPTGSSASRAGRGEPDRHGARFATELRLDRGPDEVPRARRFARAAMAHAPELADDAELVISELVTNALLHGDPPVTVRITGRDDVVRLEVHDMGRTPPLLVTPTTDAMTGRGLTLVGKVATSWGVEPGPEGGKVVWAELDPAAPNGFPARSTAGADIDQLLDLWADDEPGTPLYTVRLGPVATDLLIAAKAHVDNVVRELTLARESGEDANSALPPVLSELIDVVTGGFFEARAELKREAAAAAARGDVVTDLVLHLPLDAAEAGPRYLAALDQVDRYARAAHLLTLAPPPEHRIFREWYVASLVEQLRAIAKGEDLPAPRPFELVLAAEVARLAPLEQAAGRLALLQQVNRRLSVTESPQEMADLVVGGAMTFLEVKTARVRLLDDEGVLRSVAWRGRTAGEYGQTETESRPPPPYSIEDFSMEIDFPGAEAARTRRPIFLPSLAQSLGRYPGFAGRLPEDRSAHIIPLVAGDRTLGILTMTFAVGELSNDAETEFVASLGDVLSQALARAELVRRERAKREVLALLAEASQIMISTPEPSEVLERLVELAVPRMADWCSVYLAEGDLLKRAAMAIHGHPEVVARLKQSPLRLDRDIPHTRAYRTGQPQPIPRGTGRLLESIYPHLDFAGLGGDVDGASGLCLPIFMRGQVVGVIGMTFLDSGRKVTPEVMEAIEGLAARAAVALDNARRWTAQNELVQALVAALLPAEPPLVPGLEFAARYLPAGGDVAGDWWEASLLGDGSVLIGLGDAAGHGVAAVSDMCELRYGARALAMVEPSPAALLADLNRRMADWDAGIATAIYGRLQPETGVLRWAGAGHVPPLHVSRNGSVTILESAGTPLGSPGPAASTEANLTLEPGDTLMLYSDGVVERRDEDLGDGILRLAGTLSSLAEAPLDVIADAVILEHCADPIDDCCLLLVRWSGAGSDDEAASERPG